MWNSCLMSEVEEKSLKKSFSGNFGKTGPEKCLYCDLQTCECFKELRRARVYKHFVFQWVSSYKFPLVLYGKCLFFNIC